MEGGGIVEAALYLLPGAAWLAALFALAALLAALWMAGGSKPK